MRVREHTLWTDRGGFPHWGRSDVFGVANTCRFLLTPKETVMAR